MFYRSRFNDDISRWNVSKLEIIEGMFQDSQFNGDISNWTPYSLEDFKNTKDPFLNANCKKPYWYDYADRKDREIAINAYQLEKELKHTNNDQGKKLKI
jgi:hypothetical protein